MADGSGIAIVEGPDDRATNRAYIVNADGSLRARVSCENADGKMIFYDVLYMRGFLTFLVAASDRDVRLRVDEKDGAVLNAGEFR